MSLFKKLKKIGITYLLPGLITMIVMLIVIPLTIAEKSENIASNKEYAETNARVSSNSC